MFPNKVGVYQRGESLNFLTLITSIRLGWECLPETNTLAYMSHFQVTKKIFYKVRPTTKHPVINCGYIVELFKFESTYFFFNSFKQI